MEIGGYIGEGLVAPVWVRGLKHTEAPENLQRLVAPVWVRGLKHGRPTLHETRFCRTRMGAWIETSASRLS